MMKTETKQEEDNYLTASRKEGLYLPKIDAAFNVDKHVS
jgi:hypothetical protein